jgi:hypothetical protein
MPHTALNRVIVRMLFDPTLVEQIYAAPKSVLDPLGIPQDLQQNLLETDKRAWGVDHERRKRSLHSLMGEFPCSTTIALAHTRKYARLEAFFSSDEFHQCVQRRESMTSAFVAYLRGLDAAGEIPEPQFSDILTIETQMAACRRDLSAPPQRLLPHQLCRAPGVAVQQVNAETINAINEVERYLHDLSMLPAIALCDDKPPFPTLPPRADANQVFLLLRPRDGAIQLSPVSVVIHDAMQEAAAPLDAQKFIRKMGKRGLSKAHCQQLITTLVQEELLLQSLP